VYCYAPSLIHDERRWGMFVDAKVNAPEVLKNELRKVEKGIVFLCSATDPYQANEARYRITRRCLEVLLRYEFPVIILTRSPIVLRDIDILKKFSWIRVGFSISSVSHRFYEPRVPLLERRIECLRRLSSQSIKTWVSLAPIIPRLNLTDLDALIRRLGDIGVSAVMPGLLRFQGYEESKIMFENTTGRTTSELLIGGREILTRINEIIKRHNLDDSDLFIWREVEQTRRLDTFL
jgi:DNA repair photolyase